MDDHSDRRTADAVVDRVSSALSVETAAASELNGGMVGTVYRVSVAGGPPLAAKVDDTPLDVEAKMLRYLDRKTPLPVPAVRHVEDDLLVMEYVDGDGTFDERAERDLAAHLAALHEVSADAYGFPFETLSGPYRQPNPWTDSWIEFFRDQRLLHYARAASEEGTLPDSAFERVEALADRLDDLLIEPDAPSLLHGDPWAGNVVVDDGRVRAVLDPAIYFGHDEVDLAYVDRSDSIGDAFLDEYRRRRGISAGFFEQRRDAYAAFHVLENVRFFGEQYLPRLDRALDRVGV
jgi:fructosamine-3-kinase